ncbi:MAG TPA: IS66 family transposase [Ktedonobacter sp.]|nr:IS66 family transposase [Ktedonobacter sp.]
MNAQEEIASLKEQLTQALEALAMTQEQLRVALARIEELEAKKPPPAFVKANVVKPKEKKARKKRLPEQNGVRRRETPTQIVEHRIDTCPTCSLRLGGISLARSRQVIELPDPVPVEIIEHRIYKGWCASCRTWHEAPSSMQGVVLGQGRIGVRIASLIGYLRTVLRVPIRQIRAYLESVHALSLSSGEVVEVLHALENATQESVATIKASIQASDAVQADETGWREDGNNGYIWSLCTPTHRYYEYHHSRGSQVVEQLLGKTFEGVLGSDFYAAYNSYQGRHQRCWVHLLRDIHHLKDQYPTDEALWTWAAQVKACYERAQTYTGPSPGLTPRHHQKERAREQHRYEQEVWALCQPYAHSDVPMHTLCERIERFLPELFLFVAVPGVPSHNNLAERSVRPLVIARKISGGSRSPKGSHTRMSLASLFGTWMAQGLNPFRECLALLSQPTSLPQP